jgi:hypothetical protein
MILKLVFAFILLRFSFLTHAKKLDRINAEQRMPTKTQLNVLVLDLCAEQEWRSTGTVPVRHKLEFFNNPSEYSEYNAEQWSTKWAKRGSSPDQSMVLVCKSGNSSNVLGNFLSPQWGMSKSPRLDGGRMPWITATTTNMALL